MQKVYLGVRVAIIAALVFALAGPAVLAQEVSGSVDGTVKGPNGAAMPGVLVTLTGDGFPAGNSVMTNDNGRYRYATVPPGNYTLRASLDGFADAEIPSFRVNLGSTVTIAIPMQLSAVEEVIVVTGDVPLFSITGSETTATIADEWIDKMPLGRDFTSAIDQAAGANTESTLLGGISIDGSSGSENRFIVDGMDTTNIQEGVSQKRVITDFIEEVQVKQGGYMAEFGGSTGGVISAVTKQGGSDFTGDVHVYAENNDWDGDVRPVLQHNPQTGAAELKVFDDDKRDRIEPGFTLGGPLHRDHMWFFLGYSPATINTDRTVTFLSDGNTQTYKSKTENEYATANLTGSYGKVYFRLGGNLDDQTIDNVALPSRNGTGSQDPETYNTDRDSPGLSYTASVDFLATASWSASLRGGHFEYDTLDSGFNTGVWAGPSTASRGTACQQFPADCIPAQDYPLATIPSHPDNSGAVFDFFQRETLAVDTTLFVEDLGGDHEFKLGVQQENLENHVLNGYSNTRILFYIDAPRTNLFGETVSGTFGAYRVFQIATQTIDPVQSENLGVFVQDSWRVTDRLTLNVGVRSEEENVPSFAASSAIPSTAIEFGLSDKIAPRLGAAYDILGDGTWKAYASYGVFYDITKLEMPRGSFGGDKWVDYYYGLETLDFESIISTCHVVENSSDVLPAGCSGDFLYLVDQRHPSNDPADSTIDPNLKPMESNEITLGVEHLLGRNMTVGARYVHKELKRTIEDVGVNVPGVGTTYFIANPGEGIAKDILGPGFPNQPKAVRDYDGLTLTLRKNFSNNWGFNATYTYSELTGNYSGLSSSDELGRTSPNVNRFFDGLQNTFDQNGNEVLGKLGSDRPHQFKAQVLYAMPWGTFLGLNQQISSGVPISTEYEVAPGLPFFPFGRGDRGRTETFTQTDLNLSHKFSFGSDYGLEFSLNISNLFDESNVISIYNSGVDQDLPLSDAEFFAGFNADQVIADNDISRDDLFGLPEAYQARRNVRLGVKFTF
ncbi:MAG: TonB-dependent receptor [Thermoanaerobaculia bacterium]|nr:TonB-dependent receptor [Thermoanaerobaculia bacterium]